MNQVLLVGHVGKDPEVKQLQNGVLATVALATSERAYKLPNGTEVPERTDWHSLIFFKRMAEVVRDYVKKGDKLLVQGKIRYRQYEKDGQKRYVTEIVVDNMEMLSQKKSGSAVPVSAEPTATAQQIFDGTDDLPF